MDAGTMRMHILAEIDAERRRIAESGQNPKTDDLFEGITIGLDKAERIVKKVIGGS